MVKRGLALLALCALAAGPVVAQDVSVEGCIEPGVEAGCLMLRTDDALYNVSAAEPKPKPGSFGRVTGTVNNGVSICMQGTMLSPATWEPLPDRSCDGPNN